MKAMPMPSIFKLRPQNRLYHIWSFYLSMLPRCSRHLFLHRKNFVLLHCLSMICILVFLTKAASSSIKFKRVSLYKRRDHNRKTTLKYWNWMQKTIRLNWIQEAHMITGNKDFTLLHGRNIQSVHTTYFSLWSTNVDVYRTNRAQTTQRLWNGL